MPTNFIFKCPLSVSVGSRESSLVESCIEHNAIGGDHQDNKGDFVQIGLRKGLKL